MLGSTEVSPALRLPDFFNHHMVFQRDKPIRVFGWGEAGSRVSVEMAGRRGSARVGSGGQWHVELPALPAGGPHTLRVRSGRARMRFRDVLVGDLWFCSGQSNMAFELARSLRAPAVLKQAKLPRLRHFQAEKNASAQPGADVKGKWEVCAPSTAGAFTAVGYFFAHEIHRRMKIPIGIVHSSWGGTPIEAWLPPASYQKEAFLRPLLETEKKLRRPGALLKRLFREWEKENVSADPGNKGEARGWARPGFDDRKWGTLRVPGFWEGQGLAIDGAVWSRRTVRIPAAWRGKELRLELGPIDDFDETYFNGVKVGATGKEIENPHRALRSYRIPAACVFPGKAVLAVRIFDQFGSGGFMGQKSMLRLSCPSLPREEPLPLAGRWRYRVEWSVERPSPVPQPPALPEPRVQLSRLYNGMVHGLRQVPIRGFLWYQGESNASRAAHYRQAFPALIRSWREAWRDPALPFYFVQLANFKAPPRVPGEDCWAELREAQALALSLDKTGMAVAIDAGELADIHPRDKRKVGKRLALLALARDYGKRLEDEGPVPAKVHFEKGRAVVEFEKVGKGLKLSRGRELRGFALAGRERKWSWARARILGTNRVEVKASGAAKPAALRYGWATNPDSNLSGSHGLPAAPFRTDDWPLSTEGNLWPS
jgi:sialate O-acetylesterase